MELASAIEDLGKEKADREKELQALKENLEEQRTRYSSVVEAGKKQEAEFRSELKETSGKLIESSEKLAHLEAELADYLKNLTDGIEDVEVHT